MDHQSLRVLTQQPYQVCEKSDGERRMAVALPPGLWRSDHQYVRRYTRCSQCLPAALRRPACLRTLRRLRLPTSTPPPRGGFYFINRSFEAFEVERGQELAAILTVPGQPAVMDGELLPSDTIPVVRAPLNGRMPCLPPPGVPVYLVFDILLSRGTAWTNRLFRERLHAIGNTVRLPFKQAADQRAREGLPPLPCLLLGKCFRPAKDAGAVLHDIIPLRLPNGRAVSVYREGARFNANDGLVFTPEQATYVQLLQANVAPPLLKCKPPHENTVDFQVQQDQVLRAKADAASTGGFATVPLAVKTRVCAGLCAPSTARTHCASSLATTDVPHPRLTHRVE